MRNFCDQFACLSPMGGRWELDMRMKSYCPKAEITFLNKELLITLKKRTLYPLTSSVVMWTFNNYFEQSSSSGDTEILQWSICEGTNGRWGGENRLKIVSIWQRMIEFPGLWKFTLIIQHYPSVILPYMPSFAWKNKWLQLIYIILLLNWHRSGESGLGKLLRD